MTKTRRRCRMPRPTLRFTPTAWAKLLFLGDRGPTEIGGFGNPFTPASRASLDVQTARATN